jgi:hypothetical protein
MTRAEAVAILRRVTGIDDPIALMNALQRAGLVADEAIEPKRAATDDLVRAAKDSACLKRLKQNISNS